MTTFIDEVIEDILNSKLPLAETVVILPSKRAGSFFLKKLKEHLKDDVCFLPQTLSIEELIEEISGLTAASQTQLQVELYHVYQSQFDGETPEAFLNFLGWGQTLLGDFNEIDRHLIPTDKFFDYLSAVKELNHWSTDTSSQLVTNYLIFWKSINTYYTSYKKHLEDLGLGYQGMLYRKAVDNVTSFLGEDKQHYIFCGFNALNTAEQELIKNFLQRPTTKIYWDIDPYFLNDNNHVTATFIKSYLKEWPGLKEKSLLLPKQNSSFNTPKNITATGISQNIGQVKYTGQLLSDFSKEELEDTAVILGDEALLLPLLNSLPASVKNLNVTMGLPLGQVAQAAFFESWFQLQINHKEQGYYYKDVLSILDQQYTIYLLGDERKNLKKEITQKNLVFVKPNDLNKEASENYKLLFNSWNENTSKALEQILKGIQCLKEILFPEQNWLQLEFLHAFLELFTRLTNLNEAYPYLNDIKTLKQFYKDLLSQETLDFRGDPYQGLQIMGVLESRVLDFKNIIITSLNEGTFPSGKSQNSFIPFDLKIEYKLPTYREKDAIYAYHFFRLLQRAEHINLIYNNEAGGLNSGEKSRFLLQLATDPDANYTYIEQSASASVRLEPQTLKEIEKTPTIIEAIKKHAASGFSPSALTTYIRNPVDFYYKYVLGIKELDEVEDVIAHNTLGTVVHETLDTLYKPYLNTILSKEIVEKMLSTIDAEVKRQFELNYNAINIKTGKNLIIFNVAKQFVTNFLNQELQTITSGSEIIIKDLETKYVAQLSPEICIKGTVDRVDQINGVTRILDYKTGKVDTPQLVIKDWDELITDYKKQSKAFQVLCYALMISKKETLPEQVEAGIISFKNLNKGFLKLTENKNSNITQELLETFESYLLKLIDEIVNSSVPFIEKEV
ncbi:PD-(D/E)XK nuclease family protein [Leeuwenhoekiella polynyae]|uniref:PD-(D/E)XK nuclease superfamily protein n=1 Tax=Leeuwenhoekiella polynyae TaxID=1550906 RepID=A0A4Q0P892_9FLAO|nr:PD-(D/E)XK nuclease family protein [Leeuwenhoekiella polynyae]RXG22923.1 PD-(D/E)XK nuclease superfamily protein [Leeuwenhoekiella polynyae]